MSGNLHNYDNGLQLGLAFKRMIDETVEGKQMKINMTSLLRYVAG